LAAGRWVKHRDAKTGKVWKEFEVDPATVRHYIDKLVPAAAQQIDVRDKTMEDYLDDIIAEVGESRD
jgi:hypothetical protein